MYCESLINYKRFNVKTINIGQIPIGSDFPVRVQTMTNTNTQDIETTTNQVLRSIEKGSDLVRITTPTLKDVEAIKEIQIKIRKLGYQKPLIADIHFNPKIAIAASKVIQKVRINPGNFVDSKKNKTLNFNKTEYENELLKISEACNPLIESCKVHNTVLRIGTNHGSLSDRIISKYGNTIKGLVQSTLEFINICKQKEFNNIIISIKSSNPTIMVQANRLLVAEMKKQKINFPIHLGVTEAGNKKDGRIKSAIGIGALLVDGIGDTIRVSLTEKPENEIPVALKITKHVNNRTKQEILPEIKNNFFNPYSFERRSTYQIDNIGGSKPPVVLADFNENKIVFQDFTPDFIFASKEKTSEIASYGSKHVINYSEWENHYNAIPILNSKEYLNNNTEIKFAFLNVSYKDLSNKLLSKISKFRNVAIIAESLGNNTIGEIRLIFSILSKNKCEAPVILKLNYAEDDIINFAIKSSIDSSVFLIDGLADGLFLTNTNTLNPSEIVDTSFEILQASNRRLSKTEFISCPSCGRTLFDLEEVTEKVQIRTKHLKGLKIAVMGCIVNGPGEVADADYGYIGSGNQKVSLFKGKKPVKKNIDENLAVDELVNLIKENGDWVEP